MSTGAPNRGFGRFTGAGLQRGLLFGVIILTALIAFEAFNFSTTQYALNDLLGDLTFAGFRWATILAIAFCGIDFAGIARLFTPEMGSDEPHEVWYLFGAWLLAATMNAMLTWWGVSMAIINHQTQSSAVLDPNLVMKAVPIIVAVIVWLIRILIIGTFSMAGDKLFRMGNPNEYRHSPSVAAPRRPAAPSMPVYPSAPAPSFRAAEPQPRYQPSHRPVHQVTAAARTAQEDSPIGDPPQSLPEPVYIPEDGSVPEPTYHPMSERGVRSAPRTGRQMRD